MNMCALHCVFLPPFHHDWKLVEGIEQDRQAPFVYRGAWADPTQYRFRENHFRCARCGKESWRRQSDAPMWVRYVR
jgi:hypothetical protein